MYYPRILVVSNNSFSKTDSNGRTLGNLFIGWPKAKIAQFCVSSDGADFDICDNYYCVTDGEVLDARLHFRKAKRIKINPTAGKKNVVGERGRGKKNVIRMLVRDLLWHKDVWYTNDFRAWVDEFLPEIVLVFYSDSAFILDMATYLSKQLNVPLIMFSTEGYYFFKKNYFRNKSLFDNLILPLYQWRYRKHVDRMMSRVSRSMYLNDLLLEDYQRKFHNKSMVIYTTSTLKCVERTFDNDNLQFSYIGNMTFGRPKALLEIADVLQEMNAAWKLNVYGKPLKEEDEVRLKQHPGITFHGFVSYDEVKRILCKSQVLFHAESQEKRWYEGLKYGFSTKIADSISSGACFVLYSSPDIACAKYIKETGAGWFASDKATLKACLNQIVNEPERRNAVLEKAKEIAKQNHSAEVNSEKFDNIVVQTVEEYRQGVR